MNETGPQSRSRYQVITTLGQGGMARVLLTMSRGPAGVTKLLVVKELKEELKVDPEFVTMFLDEARIAARLNHPNVIQTYEVSHDGAHPVIVMEYLEGQPLNLVLSRIGRKKMPLDLHLHILSQVSAGLHYAHDLKDFGGAALGLVHRDVSPQNVFVTYDGRVLIVDFGIAKAADSAGLTKAGVFKGKVGYAAPEQLAATPSIDRRADVFALGVMLWEALAGKRLAQGEHELGVMNRRLQGQDPKIRDVAPETPEELCRICDRAMAHDPADRFATAAELRAAIDAYLETSRRIGAEEIGALVRETFAEDRERVRALIEGQIKSLQGQATTGERPSVVVPIAQADAVPTRVTGAEPGDSTVKGAATTARPSSNPKQGSSPVTKIAIAAVAAAVIAGVLLTRGSGPPAASEATAGSATATARPGEAAAAATVEVSIDVEPKDARITLDDNVVVQNPFRSAMPRSTLARKLRVVAPGFVTDERLVTFDRDVHLQVALKPDAAASATATASAATEPGAAASAAPARPGAPVGAAPVSGSPAAANTAATTPATAKKPDSTPGDKLTGPQQKKTRAIDDTF